MAQTIKEAENSSSNDVQSLLRRLNLYYRAVNNLKISSTAAKILEAAKSEKSRYIIGEYVKYVIKDEFFNEAETFRIYLQKIDFDGDIYYKFHKLCADFSSQRANQRFFHRV